MASLAEEFYNAGQKQSYNPGRIQNGNDITGNVRPLTGSPFEHHDGVWGCRTTDRSDASLDRAGAMNISPLFTYLEGDSL